MEALPPAVDVLVVGYRPVGATVANLLARHGVKVMVVDRSTEVFMAPRAIPLDNEALREHATAAVRACRGKHRSGYPSRPTAASCPARQLGRPRRRIPSRAGALRLGRCSPA
ncbi:FAD-dependent monooxygenase [Paraburkholderia hospita]|uniref:FAD-dependent monooxygenase n=1 Tax=Paraburkholderia hospita TaxID=169430 RepID=UPI001F61E356|nr:FAD-dependent monooxygenase [Paraburkholderia hospita]